MNKEKPAIGVNGGVAGATSRVRQHRHDANAQISVFISSFNTRLLGEK
jgi:hypothetical protein